MAMLLFRLVDVPRTVRRLSPPAPLVPGGTGLDLDDAVRETFVEWTLRPALLSAQSTRARTRVAEVIALYDEVVGRPRSAVEALAPRVEDVFGDYRLARCVTRAIETLGYHFAPPPRALPLEASALRALCYRRVQEQGGGYVPSGRRAAFLRELAAEVGATAEQVEADLWADRPGAALLRAGPAPADEAASDRRRVPEDGPLRPARVVAHYNAGAVATLLAASSWVTLTLRATETAALKDLYRHAKALHVGIEIALHGPVGGEDVGDVLAVTLYGPGSRALVRGRQARATTDRSEPGETPAGRGLLAVAERPDGEAYRARATTREDTDDETIVPRALSALDDAPEGGIDEAPEDGIGAGAEGVSVPAPGGPPVAAVVTRLLQRHPRAVREGWTRLLGPDGRLFHVPLDAESRDALRVAADDPAESDGGATDTPEYDSLVEAAFARAFLAAEADGRLGVARGWAMEREPRAVSVDGSVFLPDFSFKRDDVEVLCEVVGYYTEDYLARKRRKLAHLRGRIQLLLIVDQERASLFAASGFPLLTYRAGRQVSVTEVAQALDAHFDPFARRRARAGRALADLCAAAGPRLTEEEICAAVGCAGRTELTTLWSDVLESVPAGAPRGVEQGDAPRFQRCYVPGYGLVSLASVARARAALAALLDAGGDGASLEEALACCAGAGAPDPDEALIAALGGVVVRSGLFGEARVYQPGAEADLALTAALAPGPSGRKRRRP